MSHFDIIFRRPHLSRIITKRLFPNAKEWSESYGMYKFVTNIIGELDNANIDLFSIGDGHTPRTAAIFAVMSAWNCHSIDPSLRLRNYNIERLSIYKDKIENLSFEVDKAIIVCVHCHAEMNNILKAITANTRYLFNMQCCFDHGLRAPDESYVDDDILGPHNRIDLWRKI